jgi:protein-S-isoprenylcysteine O-methyltransferase Ste14
VLYTLVYIFLARAGGAPSTMTPWLNIPADVIVRHPGYLGMLLSLLAFPLLINSYWAFVPTVVAAVLLLFRTMLEDRVLISELPGYQDYAGRTRWRLVPPVF